MLHYVGKVIVTMVLTAEVACASHDVGFERYECYRDLCVSRRQFCSSTEQRCKYCEPAHCLQGVVTPKECVPLCPELLKSTTTTPTTTSEAKAKSPTTQSSSASHSTSNATGKNVPPEPTGSQQNGVYISSGTLLLTVTVLAVLLVVILTLLIVTFLYVRRLDHRLNPAQGRLPGRARPLGSEEEGQALLFSGWESKSGSGTNGSESLSATSSQPTKPAGPAGPHRQEGGQNIQSCITNGMSPPSYTARPCSQLGSTAEMARAATQDSTDGVLLDSLKHQKGYDYRILTAAPGQPWSDTTSAAQAAFTGHPPADQFPDVWKRDGEETCPKSV